MNTTETTINRRSFGPFEDRWTVETETFRESEARLETTITIKARDNEFVTVKAIGTDVHRLTYALRHAIAEIEKEAGL